uniref:Lysozyme g n=1 Tax=Xenopus tropicalis TaxID=8364 RepID=A0A803KIW9_XENTR
MFSEIFPFVVLLCSVSASGQYGDINKVPTSGASCRTAKQDKLTVCGVQASERMAQTDLTRMNRYRSIIESVSRKMGMDAALIAGIISRESRAGNVLINGWGDNGNAFGLMQVDKRFHKISGAWNSEEHVTQGTEILIGMFASIKRKFPQWSTEQHLKGKFLCEMLSVGSARVYRPEKSADICKILNLVNKRKLDIQKKILQLTFVKLSNVCH